MRVVFPPAAIPLPQLPPAPSAAPSVLALSMHKAGSTLLFDMLRELAPHAGLAFFSIEDHFFQAGVKQEEMPREAAALILPAGYCYGGFRGLPPFDIPILRHARTAILVRDPRDMAVSNYYSVTRSHAVPQKPEGDAHFMERARQVANRRSADEHALIVAQNIYRQFDRYAALGLLAHPSVAVYRYEDVIFRKRDWLADLCAWYGWPVPRAVTDPIADRYDIVPAAPDPAAHIRQVHPGNHRTELQPGTIKRLDAQFARWLHLLGYA